MGRLLERHKMTRDFVKRIMKIAVLQKGKEIFSEQATFIEIVDESGGEFIEISQCNELEGQRIRIDDDEWPHVREAVNEMFKEIKKHQKATP